MRLATSTVLSTPYRLTRRGRCSPTRRRLAWPAQHRQHVGQRDVCLQERQWIVAVTGQLECLVRGAEALVAAAEVGEVAAQFEERPHLDVEPAPTSRASASACSQIGSDSSKRHASISPRASASSASARATEASSAGTSVDDALEGVERGLGPAALVQVAAEAVVEARRAQRVGAFDEVDRSCGRARPHEVPRRRGWRARQPERRARRDRAAAGRRRRAPPTTA